MCKDTPSKDVCCVCGTSENVKRCGKCKLTSYCSGKCQKSHVSYHAAYCSAISDLQKLEKEKLYRDYSVHQKQIDFRTKKKILKLVGDKPMLTCSLDGEKYEVLWDTGSMISLVDRRWLKKNFPDKKIISVDEFLGNEELHVRAANSTEIEFDGVVLLNFSLGKGDGFVIPVIVSSQDVNEPILGYNVIEHLILNGSPAQRLALKSSLRSSMH